MIIKESTNLLKQTKTSPTDSKSERISDLCLMLRSAINAFDETGNLSFDTFIPRVSRFNPEAAIKRIVGLFANESSSVTFLEHVGLRRAPTYVIGDVARMQQVLLILLRQTLDNNLFESEVYVSTSQADGMLSVIVSNS